MKLRKIITLATLCSPLLLVTNMAAVSCNKTDRIENLYNSTLNEFYEWCKVPHPSGSLDKAREYIFNKVKKMNITLFKDKIGNVWFDVPATKGYENYPKIVLQGHMDMVVAGMSPEEAKVTPIVPEITKDEDGREIMHSKDFKTSLGADDGIALSSIFAIINDSSVHHGPLRILFTVDEETGMDGAINLDKSAIDSHYLFSLDGEGNKDMEYIVCNGTCGVFQTKHTPHLTPISKTLGNNFLIQVKGFQSGHCGRVAKIDKDKNIISVGNANRFLFEVLNDILGKNKSIEIASASDWEEGQDKPWKSGILPKSSQIGFATDATEQEVSDSINKIRSDWEKLYKGENWTTGGVTTTTITTPTITNVISSDDSKFLIESLGKTVRTVPTSIDDFEGKTTEEKISKNYISIANNCVNVKIDANQATTPIAFALNGYGSSEINNNLIKQSNKQIWIDKYNLVPDPNDKNLLKDINGNIFVNITSDINVWDGSTNSAAVDYSIECFKKLNITPGVMKPPMGFAGECGYFEVNNSVAQIHQVQLGPRLENTHTVNETLYLDTFKNFIKLLVTIVENVNLI